jgi:patatin-related protein
MTQTAVPGPATGSPAAPLCAYTQEVRFAVVLYGGVSLAIYIDGIAEELRHLVRASAPAVPSAQLAATTRAWLPNPEQELRSTEVVYRKLAQHISAQGLHHERDDTTPLRTRFVVDILSGSSAGGINAILLAKALANDDEELQPIHDLWVSEGDIAKLLNDGQSLDGLDKGMQPQTPRRSVLNSDRMYYRLLEAFDAMDENAASHGAPRDSRLVDELDCWITTTDLRGLIVSLRLADEVVEERRYRNVYRFVYRSTHTNGTGAGVASHFQREDNPFLAFAARCTSSFPGAFDPMKLTDIDPMVALPVFAPRYQALTSTAPAWQKFTPAYEHLDGDAPFRVRAFGDGGILDNKPFSWATATLQRRRADVPVDRRLIYLEPAPDPVGVTGTQRPDMVETVSAAVSLPRQQTIREDLDLVRRRNTELMRLKDALSVVDRAIVADPLRGLPVYGRSAWLATPLQKLVQDRGLQWAAYHRLHVDQVLDDLAELVTRHLAFDSGSGGAAAVRALAQVWFDATYETETNPNGARQAEFLSRFSLGYRLRRLHFLSKRIEDFLTAPSVTPLVSGFTNVPTAPGWEEGFVDALWTARRQVNAILVDLRHAGRGTRRDAALGASIAALGFRSSTDLTDEVLRGARTPEEVQRRAQSLVATMNLGQRLADVAGAVAELLEQPLIAAGDALQRAVTSAPTASTGERFALEMLRYYVEAFENYDAAILPISYGASGESSYVEVTRISPQSATALIKPDDPKRRKLGGDTFGHFGGFFKEDWRRNDIMWGRLDAAERLITTLVPFDGDSRSRNDLVAALVREAQTAILHDARQDIFRDFTGTDEALYAYVQNDYSVDLQLDQATMMGTAQRGLAVTSEVFDGIASAAAASLRSVVAALASRLLGGMSRALSHSTANVVALEVILFLALFGIAMSADIGWLAWLAVAVAALGGVALAGITLLRRRVAKALTPTATPPPTAAPPATPPAPPSAPPPGAP